MDNPTLTLPTKPRYSNLYSEHGELWGSLTLFAEYLHVEMGEAAGNRVAYDYHSGYVEVLYLVEMVVEGAFLVVLCHEQ